KEIVGEKPSANDLKPLIGALITDAHSKFTVTMACLDRDLTPDDFLGLAATVAHDSLFVNGANERLPQFFKGNPTPDQVNRLFALYPQDDQRREKVILLALGGLKSKEEFKALNLPGFFSQSVSLRRALDRFEDDQAKTSWQKACLAGYRFLTLRWVR